MKQYNSIWKRLQNTGIRWLKHSIGLVNEGFHSDCSCILCLNPMRTGDPLAFLCIDCFAHLPSHTDCCHSCGEPFSEPAVGLCENCCNQPPAFDQTHYSYLFAPPLDGWIRLAKDHKDQAWILKLTDLMKLCPPPADWISNIDAVVFVPGSRKRLLLRGFNPGEDIARAMAKHLSKPVLTRAIERAKHSDQRGKTATDRKQNLKQSLLAGNLRLDGQHILLIDDVMTTSATANRVAEILRQQGAAKVSNWVLARTPGPGFQKGISLSAKNLVKK